MNITLVVIAAAWVVLPVEYRELDPQRVTSRVSGRLDHCTEGPGEIRLQDLESGSARSKIEHREGQNPVSQLETKGLLVFGSFRLAAFREITPPCYVQSSHE